MMLVILWRYQTCEFNFVDSVVQGLGRSTEVGLTGTWEQFWLDDLPATTSDLDEYQRELVC